MAPLFSGIAGSIKGQAGFGFGRRAGRPKSFVTTIYSFTGSYAIQGPVSVTTNTVSVPGDTTTVTIECIGSGGGGDRWGGRSRATFTNLQATTLTANFGGAGLGAVSGIFVGPWQNGTNYAGVFNGPVSQPNALVIGGGAGSPINGYWNPNTGNNVTPGPSGTANGGGGNNNGNNGLRGERNDTVAPSASVGRGGTTTGGGAGGSAHNGGTQPGNPGSALQGGMGGRATPGAPWDLGGGGGGGGWYGGGGGGGGYTGPQPLAGPLIVQAGGGGGSGYIHPSGTSTISETGSSLGSPTSGSITITVVEFK